MLSINCAYTAPINPSGAQPVLSRAQVWKGLQRKIRRAQDFVPIIRACEVLEEREDEVVRMAYFHRRQQEDKGGEEGEGKGKETGQTTGGGGGGVREVCRSYPMTKIDFHQESGAIITNTISDGGSLADADMNMTYTFEWRHKELVEGSAEHERLVQQHREEARMAVTKSIEAMRRMAADGELD